MTSSHRPSHVVPFLTIAFLLSLWFTPGVALALLRCNDCHGISGSADYSPRDAQTRDPSRGGIVGNHRSHLPDGATAESCNPCHNSPDAAPASYSANHRDGKIQVSSNINNSSHPDEAGYYKSGERTVFFNQTTLPLLGSCRNVNCHFESPTSEWGSELLAKDACTSCHEAPPVKGAHTRHNAMYGADTTSCSKCHLDHTSESDPLAHARQAGTRPLAIRFNTFPNRTGSYSGDVSYPKYLPSRMPANNGSCSNLYCHSSGKAGAPQPPAPAWDGGALGCNSCHGAGTTTGVPDYPNGGEAAALANSHTAHTKDGSSTCADCHTGTTINGSAISAGSSLHLNQKLDVTFRQGGSYDNTTKTCSGTSCHGDGNPVWGGGITGGVCTLCHGGDADSSTPMRTGSHRSHMNNYSTLGRGNNLGCTECHATTVTSNTSLISSGRHRNSLKDYSGSKAGRIAASGSGVCTNTYCHSSGTKVLQYWNMSSTRWTSGATVSCTGCHGGLTLPGGTFQSYTSVAGEPTYPNSGPSTPLANSHQKHVLGVQSDTTGCSRCHRTTVDTTISNKLRDYSTAHLDRTRSVSFAAIQGRYSATTQQCINLYCHSNGLPFDNSTTVYRVPTWGDSSSGCGSCHGDSTSAGSLSGRHSAHTASTMYVSTCDRCHNNTLDRNGNIIDKRRHANSVKDIAFREGGSYDTSTKGCGSTTYCHSNATGATPVWGTPIKDVKWSDRTNRMTCFSCHKGRTVDSTSSNCDAIQGKWSSSKEYCTPSLTMSSNGHDRLVGQKWIRKYPCHYCHNNSVDTAGNIKDPATHLNGTKDIAFDPRWNIVGRDAASYEGSTQTCANVYCHSDGTTNPETVRDFPWTRDRAECNTCHGHPRESCSTALCHDRKAHPGDDKVWSLPPKYWKFGNATSYTWPAGDDWKAASPMYKNEGAGLPRANSHAQHMQTNFSCDNCHATTIVGGACNTTTCHATISGLASMSEATHLNGTYHVSKQKDIVFKDGGTYYPDKTCRNTKCHTGRDLQNDPTFRLSLSDPVWGGSANSVVCVSCHGTTTGDVDNFGPSNSVRAKINTSEWVTTGHGRMSSATTSRYPGSGNPAASFPVNPCWYCHDNRVLHNSTSENFFRLRLHPQFQNRFEKECVFCHMEGNDSECLACHKAADGESLAPQLSAIFYCATARWPDGATVVRENHAGYTTCTSSSCHYVDLDNPKNDQRIHNQGAGYWSRVEKEDVKNQYVMMGVCLKCHDDDSGGKCTACHTGDQTKYKLGFDPGTGYIKPKVAKATSAHFGYKHYRAFMNSGVDYGKGKTGWNNYTGHSVGTWKGGKFCWDCHDPHGDSNIYMIQSMVATSTDGTFGVPMERAKVVFTRKKSGSDYTTFDTTTNKYTGICNVCHSSTSKHYTSTSADSHNASKICTSCHEHRFTDSHADGQSCNSCHVNKPLPRHSGFGLPRDCTKCHTGTIGKRMDVMGQFAGTSHHVQGVTVTNKQCYTCHWESTREGIINNTYHEGYNYKTYTTIRNAKVDLTVWQPGTRPTYYNTSTAVQFTASLMGADNAASRGESAKLNNHCIGCHNDGNNDSIPFNDCKTPRQYAWDYKSIAARYYPQGDQTTTWGKYATNGKKNVIKAFSAHGNASKNEGGWSSTEGTDANIPNLRNNTQNVQCFDCHSSHGSKLVGTTSSYITFNGTRNGGNLKETVAGTGGYTMTYKASANVSGINPYNAGAGQCFDCHFTKTSGTTPWGFRSTFGLTSSVKGYFDTERFAAGANGSMGRYPYKTKSMKGGHLMGSSPLPVLGNHTTSAQNKIRGLCTPCHDPHGVTPTLEPQLRPYAVPMLKGTWLTSPHSEDVAPVSTRGGTSSGSIGTENVSAFAGLCVQCHTRGKLTGNGANNWKGVDRIHTSVKGWGGTHSFTCSKCHVPHVSAMPRLMITNCYDWQHRGRVPFGGTPGYDTSGGKHRYGSGQMPDCHPGAYPDNSWNYKTPWPTNPWP